MTAGPPVRHFLHRVAFALMALVPFALAGCSLKEYPQSTLSPRSDYALTIDHVLHDLVFWVVVIFVVVWTLLIVAIIRFRARPGAPEPKPVHGNTFLEIAWTIAPAIILALVAVPTVLAIFKTQAAPPRDALHVRVVGHQWWWEFQYPDLGITTASELVVPVHRTVAVDVETADVIHSFWIPAMGGKRDAIPNHVNHMWFTPDSLGTYPGQCAELCGLSHANMHLLLHVRTPQEFEAWVAAQKAPPVQPDSGTLAWQGKQLYSQQACIGCHTIRGISGGAIGPNLTHFGSRTTIAGAMYANTHDNLARWIAEPDKRKPGSLMLNLGLKPDQVEKLVAYLESLK